MALETLRCPHCNAPLQRAGDRDPVECPYCHAALTASKPVIVGAPAPGSGSGSTAIIIGVVALVGLLGAAAAFFLFGLAPAVAASPSIVTAVPVTPPAPPAPPPPPAPPSPVKELSRFGEAGTNPGQLEHARFIALLPDGAAVVSDGVEGRLQKFDAAGKYVDTLTLPPDKLTLKKDVFGLTSDAKGKLYVNRVGDVLVYDGATLKLERTIQGSYPERYYHGGLAVQADGSVLALTDNTGDTSLLTVSPQGKVLHTRRVNASRVAVDGAGRVFLAGDHGLEVQDEKGATLSKVGGFRGESVAFDGKGHVFVATGSEVLVFGVDGTKLISLPVRGDNLALDAQGRLHVASQGEVVTWEATLP